MTFIAETPDARLTSRSIRSFVLRQGRMSPAQTQAYQTLMPRFGIPYVEPAVEGQSTNPPFDFTAVFGRSAPTILEIGSGMGETTAVIAEAMPEKNFIAVEVHTPGVGALLKLIEAKKLTNLRVIQHDAVEVVQHMIGTDALAGIHLFFADPWPKARHHKRRIVQPPFVTMLAARLAPGGYLHCATDWEPYATHMLEVLSSEPQLTNSAVPGPAITDPSGFAPRPSYRPVTKFETRGIKLGHGVWDLIFIKPSPKGSS